ncbi:MAG: hypothetical protein LBQ03_03225 [Puniceicoccales bacterium]|jgi:DNA-binding MarR family transcriptional regulator|nr:hypothetical protein [Puniceicoccales bacterium]
MSAINNNFRDIRSELDTLQKNVVNLCAQAKENRGIAQKGEYTVNGQTYNVSVTKPRGFFRNYTIIIKPSMENVTMKPLKEENVKPIIIKGFSASKSNFEYKAKHAVLSNIWHNRKSLSMEQKARLFVATKDYRVGTHGEKVDVREIVNECLGVIQKNGTEVEKQKMLEAEARSRGVNLESLTPQEKAEILQNLTPERKAEILQNLTPEEKAEVVRQRADALLGLNIALGKLSPEAQISPEMAPVRAFLLEEAAVSQQIADDLFAVVKDSNLPEADREKAGELLNKMYNNPETPKSTKEAIASQVREAAKSLNCDMKCISFGVPKAVMDQVIGDWGLPDGVIPQVHDPVSRQMFWPGKALFKTLTTDPDTERAELLKLKLDKNGIIKSSFEECLAAQYPGSEIKKKLINHGTEQYAAYLVETGVPNEPPAVVIDLKALNGDGLDSLSEKIQGGASNFQENLDIRYGIKSEKDREKMKQFALKQRPIEKKDEFLSTMNAICSEYETTLKRAKNHYDLLNNIVVHNMVGVFSADKAKNGGFAMKLVPQQAQVSLDLSGENAQKALSKAISNAIKKGYTEGMTDEEQKIIIRAAKIVTGRDMTFEEIVAKFRS